MFKFLRNIDRKGYKARFGARDILKFIGPGLLVTVGFIDPGNWASNIAAGSQYGYTLLWMVTLSTFMLIVLQHNAAHLGIVTGKSRRGVERLLATNGFGNCFVVSRCADDCPSKPHPAMVLECCDQTGIAPINTLVVGDTSFDMEMAASAGAAAIGVSWGYHPLEKLIAPYVRAVVDTPEDLEDGIVAWKQGFRAAGSSNRVAALADVARAHFLYA